MNREAPSWWPPKVGAELRHATARAPDASSA